MKFKILFTAFILVSGIGESLCGGSEFSSFFGTRSMSLNNLYFAGVDGLNLTIKNPAGLAFLTENVVDISIIDQMGQHEFTSSRMVHRSWRNDDFSIGGGVAWKFSDAFTAALSYAPVTDYRIDWPFLSQRSNDSLDLVLAFNVFNRIQINSITPAAGFRFGGIAVGVAANIYLLNFNMAFPVQNTQWSARGLASYQQDYKMDAMGYGFTVGVLADVTDNIRVGGSAKSGFTASLEGTADSRMFSDLDSAPSSVNIKTDFEMPWKFGLGMVYTWTPELKLNLDAEYNLWGSTSEKMEIEFDNDIWQSRLSNPDTIYGITGSSFSFTNDNAFKAGIGIEYLALDYLSVRAGYRYSQSPNTPENYNLLFPDVSTHSLSVGLGLVEGNLSIDGGIVYSFGIEEEVHKNISAISGKYNLDNIIPSVTISYRF